MIGSVPKYNVDPPRKPVDTANAYAPLEPTTSLVTKGLLEVRFIRASLSCSKIWLRVEAEEEQRAVPSDAAASVVKEMGVAAARKPKLEVETTSAESLAFESSDIVFTYCPVFIAFSFLVVCFASKSSFSLSSEDDFVEKYAWFVNAGIRWHLLFRLLGRELAKMLYAMRPLW